ncbi:MAG: Lon-like protease helical domain-containing protein, partial [Rhodospirillales bacterium]
MAAKKIAAGDLRLPQFKAPPAAAKVYPFDFSSHKRAGQALKFGLSIADPAFNIFVLGENRSGRVTATFSYLQSMAEKRPPANDWLYLFNFTRPHKPKPYCMMRGAGREFRDRVAALIPAFRQQLHSAFEGPEYTAKLQGAGAMLRERFERASAELNEQASAQGLRIQQTEHGVGIVAVDAAGNPRPWDGLSPEEQEKLTRAAKEIGEKMRGIAAEAEAREHGGWGELQVGGRDGCS